MFGNVLTTLATAFLLITSLVFTGVFLHAQEEADVPAAEEENSANPPDSAEQPPEYSEDSEKKAMTPDEQLLATINGSLAQYTVDYNDSTALQNKKKRQFTAQAALINKRYAGKSLSFKQMCVADVEPEQDLTPYGRQQAKRIIKQLKSDPQGRQILALGGLEENPLLQLMVAASLATCKKCMRETGRYEVKFAFWSAGGGDCSAVAASSVEKLVSSESEALKYKKGEVYPVSGTVRLIKFDSNSQSLETKIFLK